MFIAQDYICEFNEKHGKESEVVYPKKCMLVMRLCEIENYTWKKNTSFPDSNNLPNKRYELVAKCPHQSEYLLRNVLPTYLFSL